MSSLRPAHQGYAYQDLMVACRLVDVVLGNVVEIRTDDRTVVGDCFDDLKTVDVTGTRECIQIKYTQHDAQPLSLATFTTRSRRLRLDEVVAAALADREAFEADVNRQLFRIVLRDVEPVDPRLGDVLLPAPVDPGPFVRGLNTTRLAFDSTALWVQANQQPSTATGSDAWPFAFVRHELPHLGRSDLEWVCEHLVVEVAAPPSSSDLVETADAERLLLKRVQEDLGAGVFPNEHRSSVDVAAALIETARAAREGSCQITAPEILRRAQLRNDYGAVSRAHPVDEAFKVSRPAAVQAFADSAAEQAQTGGAVLAVGPPGQGKSWLCHQVLEELEERGWLISEHYCYLGDADQQRAQRVVAETVFGSLTARLADADARLVAENRPILAADEESLAACITRSLQLEPQRPVALVVDGLDHVSRVRSAESSTTDPSRSLAEALASLELPSGSVLVILSQPGSHLSPLENAGARTLPVLGLEDVELRGLAAKRGLVTEDAHGVDAGTSLLSDETEVVEFLDALLVRSSGNALYATYLCEEVLRHEQAQAGAATIVMGLPAFDGTLESYYEHLRSSLEPEGAWVADLIALMDFSVTRSELKEVRPDSAHRVDDALAVLAPVLVERAMQGGVRVYHESFARFMCKAFEHDPTARIALLDHVVAWLRRLSFFEDQRAYCHLIPLLAESGRDTEVVELIGTDFVVRSIAAGFAASAINRNLARAIRCAARTGEWARVARCVELVRAAECYQRERFDTTLVEFAEVPIELLGPAVVAERLLHNDRTVMSARAGLQMCAAVDAAGAVAPWLHYLDAFDRESERDNTSYGEESDHAVALAYLRGWLRQEATTQHDGPEQDTPAATATSDSDVAVHQDLPQPAGQRSEATDRVDWQAVAAHINQERLQPRDVVAVILDTIGPDGLQRVVPLLRQPAAVFLAVALQVAKRRLEPELGSARSWAIKAVRQGPPAGSLHVAISLGVDIGEVVSSSAEEAREPLLSLTERIQHSRRTWESGDLGSWLDACTVAAHRDPLGLNAAEALIIGEGWYKCWLRFTIGLARAEAACVEDRAPLAVEAIQHLAADLNPFSGDPRACDLFSIHPRIERTIRRATMLVDDALWPECIHLLYEVSSSLTTTLMGMIVGPVPTALVLEIAAARGTESARDAAVALLRQELEHGSARRYYSDVATLHLLWARLALSAGDRSQVQRHWLQACALLSAYGWHKDVTIFELLDPLPKLIAADEARGRECLALVQPLCERVASHTDGRDTSHAPWQWWVLLAQADPTALTRIAARRLLTDCNQPNSLLHDALGEVWERWFKEADPVIAGSLRLALHGAMKPEDPEALSILAQRARSDGRVVDELMRLLLARANERPVSSGHSPDDEAGTSDELVAALNFLAETENLPQVIPHFDDEGKDQQNSRRTSPLGSAQRATSRQAVPPEPLADGASGMAMAIRAWRKRPYRTSQAGWTVDRFANAIGYRMVELAQAGRRGDAEHGLRLLATASRGFEETDILQSIAAGLERHGELRLAVTAHALAWTRARARGGWLNFGGETAINSLHRASHLDAELTLEVVAGEVECVVARGTYGTDGVSQSLVLAFALEALTTPRDAAIDVAFAYWGEAYTVIAGRTPRVHEWDDPDDLYLPADSVGPSATQHMGQVFALGVVASLSAAGREQKRRAFLAVQLLISNRPAIMAEALRFALGTVSDPATLMWLLRLIETDSSPQRTIVDSCKQELLRLATDQHLVVRALARRLIAEGAPPLPPPESVVWALLVDPDRRLWTPDHDQRQPASESARELVESVAGHRLSKAEAVLEGISPAVCARVAAESDDDRFQQRLRRQLDELGDRSTRRWPDAYLTTGQTVEQALQRTAAAGRAALIAKGVALSDPIGWEDELASALVDDPRLPLALEATRIPRPPIPAPPLPEGHSWGDQMTEASRDQTGERADVRIELAGDVFTTLTVSAPDTAPITNQRWLRGWHLIAAVEDRTLRPPNPSDRRELLAKRIQALEIRDPDDDDGLQYPPVSQGDIRMWTKRTRLPSITQLPPGAAPIVGLDLRAVGAEDARSGLGVHLPLLTPTAALMALLDLHSSECFSLRDSNGCGLALATWRTDYCWADRGLAYPLVLGSAVMARADLFERLLDAGRGRTVVRDFLITHAVSEGGIPED